jgi:WD40 repeat protein
LGMMVSPDNRLIYLTVAEKRKRNSGGAVPGFVTIFHFRAYDADSGKEVFAKEMGQLGPQMAICATRLALADGFDKVTIYDVQPWKEIAKIDTRSPNDRPPGSDKGLPAELKDFGVGGKLSDIEFTADGKTLVCARMENTEWKKTAKGFAWTSESFQNITFWDADTGKKLAALACEDKLAQNGHLHFLPQRKEMLVKFDNGVRLLDVSARKWGTIMPTKDVYTAVVSPDEKTVAVAGRDQTVKLFSLDSGSQVFSFKVAAINKTPRLDGSLMPNGYEFGSAVQFVDAGKALRVTLNDGKTLLYRSAATGEKIDAPKTEALKFPGAPAKVLAVSDDRRCAVTTTVPASGKCSVWIRGTTSEK